MEFDKNKTLTAETKDKAVIGSYGYFGDSEEDVANSINTERIRKLTSICVSDKYPFMVTLGYKNFLPLDYVAGQKLWRAKHGANIGDEVKIIKLWERGDNGFPLGSGNLTEGKTGKIVGFNGGGTDYDGEGVEVSVNSITLCIPYFAIEKIKDEYRRFANAKEFAPFRNEWFTFTNEITEEEMNVRFDGYNNHGVTIGEDIQVPYPQLLKQYVFTDTGNPAGIKL